MPGLHEGIEALYDRAYYEGVIDAYKLVREKCTSLSEDDRAFLLSMAEIIVKDEGVSMDVE